MPQASQSAEKIKVMGDKSPKSNQKKTAQKSKVSAAKKKPAAVAKPAAKKK
jgi:hypothetical protein